MESASKKRKISHDGDDGEDDEEEKMEKFYALIKSIREARDRLMNSSEVMNKQAAESKSKKRKQQLQDQEKQVVVWEPSFQLEDFLDEAQLKKLPAVSFATTSHDQSKEGADNHQKEEAKEGLDLSLSL